MHFYFDPENRVALKTNMVMRAPAYNGHAGCFHAEPFITLRADISKPSHEALEHTKPTNLI
jgi:hypothetical protein